MPKLTLVVERRALKVYDIDRPVIKVGREAGLDVVIDNVAVSRHQMEIRLQDMKWVVRDLDSGNGTFLNGKRLWGSGPLKSGDEISFGKFSLFFDHGTRWCSAPTGLTRQVRPHEIRRLAGSRSRRRAYERLVALANERGGPDNITLQLIRFGPQSLLPAALSSLRVW